MDALDPRKIFRFARRMQTGKMLETVAKSGAKSGDINLDGLITSAPQARKATHKATKATLEIHFLPLPEQLSQLLHPKSQAAPQEQDEEGNIPQHPEKVIEKLIKNSDIISRAEFEAFRQEMNAEMNAVMNAEVNAQINLRNTAIAALRARLLAMEQDIAVIRQTMFRLKRLFISGSFCMLAWMVALALLL